MGLTILTGASRGLGAALAQAIAATPGQMLLTLARSAAAPGLEATARATGSRHEHWMVDLADPGPIAERLETWLRAQVDPFPDGVTLINNAGALGPVGPVESGEPADIAAVLRINLEAPILLTRAFLQATRTWRGARKAVQISSGAGRNAYAGWSLYCATKAGLDHFTRAVTLDEALRPLEERAQLVSLAPGVIDTAMQAELRGSDPAGFPDHQRFLDLKASGQLPTPEAAAARVLAFLERADFGSRPVADVRDA
jgi:benzil reductase ((S)-benzoin forming)